MLRGNQHRCRNHRRRPCCERKVWSKAVSAARLPGMEPKWTFGFVQVLTINPLLSFKSIYCLLLLHNFPARISNTYLDRVYLSRIYSNLLRCYILLSKEA